MAGGGGNAPKPASTGGYTPALLASMANVGLDPSNPLLDPNATLSGPSLFQAGQALAGVQTQGPITELQKTAAANVAQGRAAEQQTAGYFTRLGQFANQGVRDERNIANQTNQQLARISNQTGNAFGGIERNAANSLLQYTPPGDRSIANPGMQSLTQEMARQKGLAAQDSGAFRSYGALQGGNYRGMAASNLGTFSLKGQEALKGIAQATQLENLPLNAKIAGLLATQGALTAADIGKLRQQEITNRFTAKGLSIRGQLANAATQNANTAAGSLKLTAQQDQVNNAFRAAGLTLQKQSLHDLNAYRTAELNRRSGGGTLTTSQANTVWGTIGYLAHAFNRLKSTGFAHTDPVTGKKTLVSNPSNQQIKDFLSANPQYQPYVEAADEVAGWGFITPSTWAALQASGLAHSRYPVRDAPFNRANFNAF